MPDLSREHRTANHCLHGHQQGGRMRPSPLTGQRSGPPRERPPRQVYRLAPRAMGWPHCSTNCVYSQGGLAETSRLHRGACASVTQSTLNESPSLTKGLEALRRWIETRQFAGYEPFDLLNSPYLRGAWARKALPAILFIQAGKRFAGLQLRQALKIHPSRNPKALGLCLSAYCDLAQAGYDVSAEAAWLKNELIRLRSPLEAEYCWGYDWDFVSLRGPRLPAFAPNCIASYFCGTAMMEMHKVFADSEALEIAESVARFLTTRLHRSFESAEEVCFSYTPNDKTLIYNS